MQAGGAKITLSGFSYDGNISALDLNTEQIALGKRVDGRLAMRALSVFLAIPKLWQLRKLNPLPDIILARNIEMLFLAFIIKKTWINKDISIIYECLDIHKMQLESGWKGRTLRGLEERLISQSSAIIISSPAFKSNYFSRFTDIPQDVLLLENKLLDVSDDAPMEPSQDTSLRGTPWKIGWFGTLRCQKSMLALSEFAKHTDNQFKIVLRGKPVLSVHDDFFGQVEAADNIEFFGNYRNPEDIENIYGDVHFSWLIDFYEEGQNSNWLLPNRLYEGCRFGAVPIALAGTETARVLEELNIGITLPDVRQETLTRHLTNMSLARYAELKSQVLAIPQSRWSHSKEDCVRFVQFLSQLAKHGCKSDQAVAVSSRSEIELKP